MVFEKIDLQNWRRKEFFEHYFSNVPCTYSMTTGLDVSRLYNTVKINNLRLYPVLIYCISHVVNDHEEFRMGLDAQGNVGIYDSMNPAYTVFHKETETFSNLWTAYHPDFQIFYRRCVDDLSRYGNIEKLTANPTEGNNSFPISSIPWTGFTGFNLNLQKGFDYLPPIFTTGKILEADGRRTMPLSIQVHHAVCDGYHVARLLNELQILMDSFVFIS